MQKPVLTISELRANVEDKEILKGVNLEIKLEESDITRLNVRFHQFVRIII